MKKILVLLTGLVLFASVALGASSATLQINATVLGSCTFHTNDVENITLDPSSGLPVSVISNGITLTCTNGTVYTITDNGGISSTYLLDNGIGDTITYTLTYTNTGTGTGLSTIFPVTIDIPYANYQTATTTAPYVDTVTFSVLP